MTDPQHAGSLSDDTVPNCPISLRPFPTDHHDPITSEVLALIGKQDPDIASLIAKEGDRQEHTLELIASENHVSPAVLEAMGSVLTNKYAEGYPGKRYYGGCEFYDQIENIAIDRAKQLFGCRYANVQPHSGANANLAAFMAMMKPGDTFASLMLKDGGHLSHGMSINFSGIFYRPVHYPLHYAAGDPKHEQIDYDAAYKVCMEHKPEVIMRVLGVSAGDRFQEVPRDRGCVRGARDGGYRAHRGAGRGGRASVALPARARGDDDDAQDAARAARRAHHDQ